jgi:DNA-directed RNA polymerase subunit delta
MEDVKASVSYLKGLVDGLEVDKESKEGKIITEMVKVLDTISDSIGSLHDAHDELDEYVNTMDEDLAKLEDDFYGDEDDEDDDDNYVQVECPNCHETVYLDKDMLDDEEGDIVCPNCNKPIDLSACDCSDPDCHCCD